MAGRLWPGCTLPGADDVVDVDLEALNQSQALQVAQGLGLAVGSTASHLEVLSALRASKLDEHTARGQ